VTDTSVTVCFEPRLEPLVQAADEALGNAIRAFRPGVKLSEIGRVVQSTIQKYGLRPISNLTGHKIERYSIHAGKSVPNVGGMNGTKIEEGEVYAIEPFTTLAKAAGMVTNGSSAYIYRFVKPRGATSEDSKKVIAYIQSNRSEEHTSELQSLAYLVCRLLLEKKNKPGTMFCVPTSSLHSRWSYTSR